MTPLLADELQPYGDVADYPDALAHNIALISEMCRRPAIARYVRALARATGVEAAVVERDLQRHVLVAHESAPESLRRRQLTLIRTLGDLAHAALKRGPAVADCDVLLDLWYKGAADSFYGSALLEALTHEGTVAKAPVNERGLLSLWVLPWCLGILGRALREVRAVRVAEGLDLTRHLQGFLGRVGRGRSLRGRVRVIVSGNDNGFPAVLAAAAGSAVVLIQNGLRPYVTDSAFLTADEYISMGGEQCLQTKRELRSRFGNVVEAGSLRLHNFLHSAVSPVGKPLYDILYVSCHQKGPEFDRMFHNYSMEHERAAIAAIAAVAEAEDLRVAFYPREQDEIEALRNASVLPEAVEVVRRDAQTVYAAAAQARVVLSSFSTVSLEAWGLGRPGAYLNLSGNRRLVPVASEDRLEHTDADPASLASFLRSLMNRRFTKYAYLKQQDVPAAVRAAVRRLLRRASG